METSVTFFEGGVYDQSMFGAFLIFKTNQKITLPETNIAPARRLPQKETIIFQPSIFRCYIC